LLLCCVLFFLRVLTVCFQLPTLQAAILHSYPTIGQHILDGPGRVDSDRKSLVNRVMDCITYATFRT
jgi:hypothetical protein